MPYKDKETAKASRQATHLANREKVSACRKAWYAANRNAILAKNRAHRQTERAKAVALAYRAMLKDKLHANRPPPALPIQDVAREKRLARYKRHRERHREKRLAYMKAWEAAHRKERRTYANERYRALVADQAKDGRAALKAEYLAKVAQRRLEAQANDVARAAKIAAWNKAAYERAAGTPEWRARRRKSCRAYRAKYPARARELSSRRGAIKRQTQVEKVDFQKILSDAKGVCGICRQPFDEFGIHFDHIIPLSKGGTHTRENIQPTHARCNLLKGAKLA
jgi:5-methylcytosine-specific restriction endonuclease McrA